MQGSGKALLNIMSQMIFNGVDIFLVLPKEEGTLYEKVIEQKINHSVQPLVFWIWPRIKTIRDFILLPYRLVKLLHLSLSSYKGLISITQEFQPDIIHTNVGVIHIGHFVSKRLKIPHVWHIREYQDLFFGWKPFPSENRFLSLLRKPNNYPIAITQGVFNHHKLNSNSNSKVIYDGVFDTTNIPEIKLNKKKYFLFVGLVSEGKGTKEAIAAFLQLAGTYPEIELWIAGGGDEKYINSLKQIIHEANCYDRIMFLGHRTDVNELMSDATAMIVSSKFEGFGFITAEAMFNGCLVIGRNAAGTKEQFDNGLIMQGQEIGLRYDTMQELSNAMRRICNEGVDKYFPMMKRAQESAVSLYSSQLNTDNIYKLYRKTLVQNG
jgi:L-malate glycosyltransferase